MTILLDDRILLFHEREEILAVTDPSCRPGCHGPVVIQGDQKRLGPATTVCTAVVLSFVIPIEAEGSAVPRTLHGNAEFNPLTELSSRPERSGAERPAVSSFALTQASRPRVL
jgi:hypothetical protein